MMPERLGKTDPFKQIPEAIGSGPFKFVKAEWVPGNKAVFVKKQRLLAAQRATKLCAGREGSQSRSRRVALHPRLGDVRRPPSTGRSRLVRATADRFVASLRQNPDVVVATVDPLGNHGILRFNQLQPPFNNFKLREAVLNLVDQRDYMQRRRRRSEILADLRRLFGCGTPNETVAGAEELLHAPDLAKAKALIKEAGYNSEKIVLLDATDQPPIHAHLVTLEALKAAGLNVDMQSMDWGTLITRRASKKPINEGGWNIFHTWTAAPDLLSPALNAGLRSNGDKAWFGWPKDDRLEALIDQWFKAADAAAHERLIDQIQTEAYRTTFLHSRPASSSCRPPTTRI